MKVDALNAVVFDQLAKRKGIEDRNKIVLVAAIASGNPLMKVLIPWQMVNQAEEIMERDNANKSLTQARTTYQASINRIQVTLTSNKSPEEKVNEISETVGKMPMYQ